MQLGHFAMCAILDEKQFFTMKLLFLLLLWNEKHGAVAIQGCGSVVNNVLTSPGYPNNYPSSMDCNYVVPIPDGMALKIDFRDFDVGYLSSCKDDYLKITNENSQTFGVFCRDRTGKAVLVTGGSAVLKFHSDFFLEKRGFQLLFTFVPLGNATQVPAECGTVVNNSLKSPWYPKNYPQNMHCVYSVNIPRGMEMKIDFNHFEMEDCSSCFCDHLKITNEKNKTFGVYCGQKTGRHVLVTGDVAVITFYSDYSLESKGFSISLTGIPFALPKITSPGTVVRSLYRFQLSCSATGSPPVYVALIRTSYTLTNTTDTATIILRKEGNYTCVATNKHGIDVKNFLVIFNDCGPSCYSTGGNEWGNSLSCEKMVASPAKVMKCSPTFVNRM
ncbi:CUB domain-containing protein 2-like [Oculina patagonica]